MSKRYAKRKLSQPVKWGEVAPPAPFRVLFRPLGEIAFAFADLEQQVTLTTQTLLSTSWEEGAAMEWLMQSFTNRIELFYFLAMSFTPGNNLLAAMRGPTAPDEIARIELRKMAGAIHKDLIQANSDRNNLLHGAWTGIVPNGGGFAKDRMQAQGGQLTEIPVRGVKIALLKEEAKFIISLSMRLVDWTTRFKARARPDFWPAPLHAKYLLRSPLGILLKANRAAARQHRPLTLKR